MFPSISRLFIRWRGPKSIVKLAGGHDRNSSGSAYVYGLHRSNNNYNVGLYIITRYRPTKGAHTHTCVWISFCLKNADRH